MSSLPDQSSRIHAVAHDGLASPAWVDRLLNDVLPTSFRLTGQITLDVRSTSVASAIRICVADAQSLSPAKMERATADAYSAIADRLKTLPARHPVRFWNYIPGIHQPGGTGPAGESLDRYMVFNSGRFDACRRWLGGESAFARLLATASGVGHPGNDLVIHALASDQPGQAIENPRQVPAYQYSRRYGPCPPCFARATLATLDGERKVLVGGTASVRGEASVHVGNLPGQMSETLANLAALIRAACDPKPSASDAELLRRFSQVRIYYVQPSDLPVLHTACEQAFGGAELEFIRADLCRQDLLVEIEGVASVE